MTSTGTMRVMKELTEEQRKKQREAIDKLQAAQRENVTPEERQRFLKAVLSVPRSELEETPKPKEKRGRRPASPNSPGVSP